MEVIIVLAFVALLLLSKFFSYNSPTSTNSINQTKQANDEQEGRTVDQIDHQSKRSVDSQPGAPKSKNSPSPNAYKSWSSEEDSELTRLKALGKSVSELSQLFGRTPGAVRSRIKKLGSCDSKLSTNAKCYEFNLYHFTDPRNVPSIKKLGLLSWEQLLRRNWPYPQKLHHS